MNIVPCVKNSPIPVFLEIPVEMPKMLDICFCSLS